MNYVQYGKSTKHKKGKKSTQSGASGGNYRSNRGHGTDVAKADTRKHRTVNFGCCVQRLWKEGTL